MATRTFVYEQGLLPQYFQATNPGVYLTWDRVATSNVDQYMIFRSNYFFTEEFPTTIGPGIGSNSTSIYRAIAPKQLCFNSGSNLFLLDTLSDGTSKVIKLSRNNQIYSYIGQLSTFSNSSGINTSSSIYMDFDNILYITDISNFDALFPGGSGFGYISGTITGPGSTILSNGTTSICGFSSYLFATQNGVVQQFSTLPSIPNSLNIDWIGSYPIGSNTATRSTADINGNLYLSGFGSTDDFYNQVLILSPLVGYSTLAATTIGGITTGSAPGVFYNPLGVAIDQALNIHVADAGNNRIQLFSPDGVVQATLGAGVTGTSYLQFNNPTNVAVDNNYNLYICDTGNARLQYFDDSYDIAAYVPYPVNEFIDTAGTPSTYYVIKEIDPEGVVLNTIGPLNGDELLLRASLSYEMNSLLGVPIYDEEPIYSRDRTKARLAFDNIIFSPFPEVRITSNSNDGFGDPMAVLSPSISIYKTTGMAYNDYVAPSTDYVTNDYPNGLRYKLDWQGTIYFVDNAGNPVALQSYDSVLVSYAVRMVTGQNMNTALYLALQAINSQPGANKYQNLSYVPFYYDSALVTGASYYLIRQILLSLTQRERRMLILDPDQQGGFDPAANLKNLMDQYKSDFDKMLEKLPIASYPTISSVVVPEYALPGGRSRYFRYLWKGGAS